MLKPSPTHSINQELHRLAQILAYPPPRGQTQPQRVWESISGHINHSIERIQHYQFKPWDKGVPYHVNISPFKKEEEAKAHTKEVLRYTTNLGQGNLVYNGELEGITKAMEKATDIAGAG